MTKKETNDSKRMFLVDAIKLMIAERTVRKSFRIDNKRIKQKASLSKKQYREKENGYDHFYSFDEDLSAGQRQADVGKLPTFSSCLDPFNPPNFCVSLT